MLLYVIEDLSIVASLLNINTSDQYIEFFMNLLGHGQLEMFKRLKAKNGARYNNTVVQQQNQQGVMEDVVTMLGFQTLIEDFVKLYCTSTDLKGDLIKYIKSEDCRKPMKAAVSTHQDCMRELICFTTILEGSRPDLTEEEQKLILFR